MKNYSKKEAKKKVPPVCAASERIGLPLDALGGYPYIQINAGRELIIEGKCKILEYSGTLLCAVCRKIKIRVEGRALNIRVMDNDALVICGVITSVSFEE